MVARLALVYGRQPGRCDEDHILAVRFGMVVAVKARRDESGLLQWIRTTP